MHLTQRLEEHYNRREWLHVDREAMRLTMKESLSDTETGRVLRMWGRAKAGLGESRAAISILERAIAASESVQDWDNLGCSRSYLGALYTTLGDLTRGVLNLRSFLRDLPHYDEALAYRGKVHFNLALAFKYQRQYQEAVLHYLEALDWFILRGHSLEKGMTHQNLAWLYCTLNRLPDARVHLELADGHREAAGTAFDAEQICGWAFYYLKSGAVGDAIACVQEILLVDRPGVDTHHRGQAALVAGHVAVSIGQASDAERMFDLAMAAALDTQDRSLADECGELRSAIDRRWPLEN